MPESAEIAVRATPRARRERIEVDGDLVRVWVNAPPVEGEANAAVCRLLAKRLGLARSAVRIIRGEGSRAKTVAIVGMDVAEVLARLA
jgi:uncharacterized protein YggU (UPF0235/DUF167 family)